jgi:hypothetical protein
MKKFLLSLFSLLVFAAKSQTPTWAEDIAPILYNNCVSCHRPGGLAPTSLLTYTAGVALKNAIKFNVDSSYMPPWPPDPQYRHLAHERVLSASDKTKISQWVLGGTPQGNLNNAPPVPTFNNTNSQLSSIDYTNKMSDYVVNTTQDLYRCFIIPTNFSVDKFVAELEVKPGNAKIVHHVLVFEDTSTVALNNLDAASPGIGYTSFFGTGVSGSRLVGEWVPGTQPITFPAGMGVRLRKNTNIILQIHYPAGTANQMDSTRVNIKYTPGAAAPREVYLAPILNESKITNGPFTIPAGQVKTFKQQYINNAPPLDATILSIAPHMHLIGKKYKVYAVGLAQDTIPMINIKRWDFNWQGVYSFRNPLKVGANYKIIGETEYDNRATNPNNPNSPPLPISYGENTTDEMMQTYFAFTFYFPGDENIVIDNSPIVGLPEVQKDIVSTLQFYEPFPNPTKEKLTLSFFSPTSEKASVNVVDVNGKLIYTKQLSLQAGFGEEILDTRNWANGSYFVSLKTSQFNKTKKIIKE